MQNGTLATLEVAMCWIRALKEYVAKHPKLSKVWFVRELDVSSLANAIMDARVR